MASTGAVGDPKKHEEVYAVLHGPPPSTTEEKGAELLDLREMRVREREAIKEFFEPGYCQAMVCQATDLIFSPPSDTPPTKRDDTDYTSRESLQIYRKFKEHQETQDYLTSTDLKPKPFQATRFSGVYTRDELVRYLSTLHAAATTQGFTHPLVLHLTTRDHILMVDYQTGQFCLRDINQEESNPIRGSTEQIADCILKGTFAKAGGMAIFESTLYVADAQKTLIQPVIDAWKNHPAWIAMHEITAKKALERNQFCTKLLYLQNPHDDFTFIQRLQDFDISFGDGSVLNPSKIAEAFATISSDIRKLNKFSTLPENARLDLRVVNALSTFLTSSLQACANVNLPEAQMINALHALNTLTLVVRNIIFRSMPQKNPAILLGELFDQTISNTECIPESMREPLIQATLRHLQVSSLDILPYNSNSICANLIATAQAVISPLRLPHYKIEIDKVCYVMPTPSLWWDIFREEPHLKARDLLNNILDNFLTTLRSTPSLYFETIHPPSCSAGQTPTKGGDECSTPTL